MRKFIVIAFLISSVLAGFAQQKLIKISDPYTNPEVYPKRVSNLRWMNNTTYTLVKDSFIYKGTTNPKMADIPFISLSEFNKSLEKANLKTTKRFPSIAWESESSLIFAKSDTFYSYNTSNGNIKALCYYPQGEDVLKLNPANYSQVAFTRDNNLYMADGKTVIAVTNDENKGIVSGQTVSRSEFGIVDGIFWSPKGNLLAYYTKDETNVGEYPLVDIDAREAKAKMIRYPMAGMASELIYVNVYNPKTKTKVSLDTKELKEYYFTNVTWSPDEKFIYIQVLNREQNHMWLNKYDVSNGKMVKTLFEETNDKWVEPEENIHFLNNNNNEFVYMSERDGYYHAYLCNTDGKILKQLTKGNWVITEFKGFDSKNTKMYFMATKDSPLENNLYSVNLKSLKITRLTNEAGTHHITFNKTKSLFFDRFSSLDIVSKYQIADTKKGAVKKVLKADTETLKDFTLGEMTIDKLKADDGSDLYYRLIKPVNFDPKKKYPVIVYVYGGPHAQLVKNAFLGGGGYFLQALAAKGYVVFTLDNRGSANRGFAFESGIHRQLGVIEMQDQMKGIEFLKQQSYVDTTRIGVHGWSYGGFMTTSLMLNHPETFKVGVAGGPVIDWKYYEVMYGERYMDRPEENPEGYKNSSTLNKVKNLKGQFLIIHGTMDPTVVWQNSQMFVKKCVTNQKQLDYFIYPDHEHNVRGYDRMHLENKIAKYFDDFL
jgi:dipeptidyl-peptidase-4